MPTTRNPVAVSCAICERSLLTGERPVRFSPGGYGGIVDVCPLCQETALAHGWIREGSPSLPSIAGERRRRSWLAAWLKPKRPTYDAGSDAALRRLSEADQAIAEAAEIFNASAFRRTAEGIARSLGMPRVSIVPLSGVNTEVVITLAWDISWYQYRVAFDSAQQVRIADRGLDPGELDSPFTAWNAEFANDGRVVPDLARVEFPSDGE
jgi:hypothetical protein